MNILITAPSLDSNLNVSGVSTVTKTIIENNNKHIYLHYLLGSPDIKRSKFSNSLRLIKQLLFFPIALKKNKIELVHQNLPFDTKGLIREFVLSFWCSMFKVPVVLHIHGGKFIINGTNNYILKNIAKSIFLNSKKVLVLSKQEQEVLENKFNYKTSISFPNSVDTKILSVINRKLIHDIPVFLYLGRIEKDKGVYELIDALKLLRVDFKFKFILCGTGSLLDFCIAECSKLLSSDFEYKGVVSGEKKINIIKNSDFFLLPSYFEGLPMSLLETMAAGVVPIVTNVGSIKFVVENGINGFLIEKQNTIALYERIKLVINNKEFYSDLSINAAKTISDKFDISSYILKLNDIYNQAVN